MQQLFNKLKHHLEKVEKNFDFIHHFDDAKNVNTVINTIVWTHHSMDSWLKANQALRRKSSVIVAAVLVQRLLRPTTLSKTVCLIPGPSSYGSKTIGTNKQWKEIRKYRRDLLWFIHRLEVSIERNSILVLLFRFLFTSLF